MPVFVSYVVYFKKDKRQIICVAYTVFFHIYVNDLHNIQITTDKDNHQIP